MALALHVMGADQALKLSCTSEGLQEGLSVPAQRKKTVTYVGRISACREVRGTLWLFKPGKKGGSKTSRPGLFCALSGPDGVKFSLLTAGGRGLCKELGGARRLAAESTRLLQLEALHLD